MSKLSTLSVISNNSLATLRDYVASYAGLNGGDPRSPVWLCALEWGRGLVKAVEDNGAPHGEGSFSKYDKDYYYLPNVDDGADAEAWVRGCFDNRGNEGKGRRQFFLSIAIRNTDSVDRKSFGFNINDTLQRSCKAI